PIISIRNLNKVYASGFQALKNVNLEIRRGEIFALLGPNGAGKTTLIGIVCGIVNASGGRVTVDGHDIVSDYRAARALIGLVPQELTTDAFETVWDTIRLSRGLWGLPPDASHLEKVLKSLSLWDRKDAKIMTLSGGMKRRVMIAKALAHEPQILFLDEPTAGVDARGRAELLELMTGLSRSDELAAILVTHNLAAVAQTAERIVYIEAGRVLCWGLPQELLGQESLTALAAFQAADHHAHARDEE
ncbi:MAG TPA: ABC transporter ATP-binding protein, partial [Kofleriaceae bacterium]|nr:ABC transporter ATP-binding protein [Kofleriaceae bacterium]